MSSDDSIQRFNSEEIISEFDLKNGLNSYLDILLEYNKKVNLVSRETSRSDLIRLAADCLIPFKFSEVSETLFVQVAPKSIVFFINPASPQTRAVVALTTLTSFNFAVVSLF